jgi:hypothetical protein
VIEGSSLPWLGIKDFFAIVKNVFGLIKSVIYLRKRSKKLREIDA